LSLADPLRCARGPQCEGYDSDKNQSARLTRDNAGGFCGQCRAEHAGWYRTSSDDRWMDKITEAIETVFTQRPRPQRPYKATLRDLFDLDSRNGGQNEDSDRGAALGCLDAKTLGRLRDFLEERREEAIDKQYCDEHQYKDLRTTVGVMATLTSLPADKPPVPEKQDSPAPLGVVIHTSRGYVVNLDALNNAIPFDATAHYTGSGRTENLKTPVLAAVLAEALRQQHPRISDRAVEDTVEEVLGVPRSKQKRWHKRMEEAGMTWRRFTTDQLQYVALGKTRGGKRKS
jgi:hypothetical protein